jgi:hypothetical protein
MASLRTVSRSLAATSFVFSANDLQAGIRTGDQDRTFDGGYGMASLGVGIAFPPAGIGMGIAKLAHDLWPQKPVESMLDKAAKLVATCP